MSLLLNDESLAVLRRLLTCFSTSFGFNGRLKLIEMLEKSFTVLSSRSNRIESALKCRHQISRLVLTGIHKQVENYHDGGLYFSMILLNILLYMSSIDVQESKRISIYRSVLDLIDRINIDSVKLDFDSVHSMLSIVRAVICKPLIVQHSSLDREHVCLLSIKSYLEKITNEQLSQNQFLLTVEGAPIDSSELLDGLVLEVFTTNNTYLSTNCRPCLLFTNSLAGDFQIDQLEQMETKQEKFQWIQSIADLIVERILRFTRLHHSGVIFCQKVKRKTNVYLFIFETWPPNLFFFSFL